MQITILDFTFQNSKFTMYWQLEITIQTLGGVANPQSVIFNMTYVFLVLGNIHAIFTSPHDNLLDNMKDGHVTPHDNRWNKNLSINTVVATEVFCPQLQCHLSQNSWAAGWQNNLTVWLQCVSRVTSKFKVYTWIVPGWDDGKQQVGMPSL